MLPKKPYHTSSSFYSSKTPQMQGHPYTQYPVPVQPTWQEHYDQIRNKNSRLTTDHRNHNNNVNGFKGFKMLSAEEKARKNPGLVNIGRKANLNGYDQENVSSQAQAIRRYGMDYRRKLQQRYNSPKSNVYFSRETKTRKNHEKQMKDWYEQRNENLHGSHLQYLKKIQKALADQKIKTNLTQVEAILGSANKQWQSEVPQKLKKCFQF